MNHLRSSSFAAIVMMLFFYSQAYPATNKSGLIDCDVASLLDSLDVELGKKDEFINAKKNKIQNLRNKLHSVSDPEHRYWINLDLYNEYCFFDSDSALHYANVCYDIARQQNRQSWKDEMNLNKSYLYAATGLLDEAQKCIDKVDINRLSNGMIVNYYEKLLFIVTHRDQYLGKNSLETPFLPDMEPLLVNLGRNLPATDPFYCWFIGWRSFNDAKLAKESIGLVEKVVKTSKFASRKEAMDSWVLSHLYRKVGDTENAFKYLILSAIADVRICNKEIASLEEVSSIVYKAGDLNRANDYITYCLQCANDYNSRIRVGRLADLQYHIAEALSLKSNEQAKRIQASIYVLIFILVILVAAIGYIYHQFKRMKEQKIILNETNDELNRKVKELQETRMQLKDVNARLEILVRDTQQSATELLEANNNKERYIADIFSICSNYISKLDDFRRDIYRKIMAHKFEEVKDLTKSHQLSHGEIKELYSNFDQIFLRVYPNFVEDFNSLLRPEERITIKKGELLNTELRIYAFVRLGINDSVKISKFLHCSVQTVYNTRQRIRNKSDIPNEKFAAAVRVLGKPSI